MFATFIYYYVYYVKKKNEYIHNKTLLYITCTYLICLFSKIRKYSDCQREQTEVYKRTFCIAS